MEDLLYKGRSARVLDKKNVWKITVSDKKAEGPRRKGGKTTGETPNGNYSTRPGWKGAGDDLFEG